MTDADPVLDSLRRAVAAAPDDVPLRVHLAEVLLSRGHRDEAVTVAAAALQLDPTHAGARSAVLAAMGAAGPTSPALPTPPAEAADPTERIEPVRPPAGDTAPAADDTAPAADDTAPAADGTAPPADIPAAPAGGFDWEAAEAQVDDVAAPMFVDEDAAPEPTVSAWDTERSTLTLADVGGMVEVKERLQAAFLAPMRNPELRRLYGKSLRGGLMLYGPPGCGKTFLARAVAGELGARFLSVGLAEVLDMYIGRSEQNIHELFQLARREAPCVLFLDEIDALGQKRSHSRNSGMRGAVVQLLTELDGVDGSNEGVFVLAATNQPWDVDPALRRPGRLDRTLLVLPPDRPAREAILRYHLAQRPVEGIDLRKLAKLTEGFSGADVAHVCETAAERALLDGVRTGVVRMIGMPDLEAAVREVRPSTGPWLDAARNVVMFGDDDGTYADLRAYLKKSKRL